LKKFKLNVAKALIVSIRCGWDTPERRSVIPKIWPDREMQGYDQLVDIWPMGLIAYELIFGYQPLALQKNPWQPGAEYESLRPLFN
jgi:hypothetical protein